MNEAKRLIQKGTNRENYRRLRSVEARYWTVDWRPYAGSPKYLDSEQAFFAKRDDAYVLYDMLKALVGDQIEFVELYKTTSMPGMGYSNTILRAHSDRERNPSQAATAGIGGLAGGLLLGPVGAAAGAYGALKLKDKKRGRKAAKTRKKRKNPMKARSYTPNPVDDQTGLRYISYAEKNWSSPIKLYLANPVEANWSEDLWWLSFGAYGSLHILVWGDYLESVIEEVGGILVDHFPGHINTYEDMEDLYVEVAEELGYDWNELREANDWSDPRMSQVTELAEADMIYTESGHIPSWEMSATEVNDPRLEKMAYVESMRVDPDMIDDDYEAEKYRDRIADYNRRIKLREPNPRARKATKKRKTTKKKKTTKRNSKKVISRYLKGL